MPYSHEKNTACKAYIQFNNKRIFMDTVHIVTGVPSTNTGGTGRAINTLESKKDTLKNIATTFYTPIHCKEKPKKAFPRMYHRILRKLTSQTTPSKKLIKEKNLILFHPQSLGFSWTKKLLAERQHTWIYVLDASFFCIRSYNHIEETGEICFDCLGGNFSAISSNNCKPFPCKQDHYLEFMHSLKEIVQQGKISFFVQCQGHKDLIKKHFGEKTTAVNIGLCADFPPVGTKQVLPASAPTPTYDVVLHTSNVSAKGARWAYELALATPDINYLFPFAKNNSQQSTHIPPNLSFIPMSWESGLKDAVISAKLTLCPSLWAAPVEGALIKSIFWGNQVAVVDVQSAFSAEIPPSVVHHLPNNIHAAANSIRNILLKPVDFSTKMDWYTTFSNTSERVLDKMCSIVLSY